MSHQETWNLICDGCGEIVPLEAKNEVVAMLAAINAGWYALIIDEEEYALACCQDCVDKFDLNNIEIYLDDS